LSFNDAARIAAGCCALSLIERRFVEAVRYALSIRSRMHAEAIA
jgi:hypothetical protein